MNESLIEQTASGKLKTMPQQRYVSNKNESARMFESNFLEFFSHVHPATPHVIYLPLMGWMFYLAAERGQSAGTIAGLFLGGIAIWTLVEYRMHRWVFHYEPRSKWGRQMHFMLHGVHHDYPNDASRLVMPPVVSLPLAVVFYSLFLLLFGRFTPAAFAGLLAGYLFYDTLHYATHHFAMKRGVWRWLKKHHLRHHYQDDHAGFGVSSPLWDYVFGTESTRIPERPSEASAAAAEQWRQ
jgi:sterol desaturase/sphingolipid hydroxylase (fatty acid hydroxylase superfamily)